MLVFVGFLVLTYVGGIFSSVRPPPSSSSCDDSEPQCAPNQHYTENNTNCIKTCSDRFRSCSEPCDPYTGCVCDHGSVRLFADGTGPCVPKFICRMFDGPLCPKHQHYTENDPTCIRTCANSLVPPSDSCKQHTGCVCDEGRVRLNDDATGPCVRESTCSMILCGDPNAEYKTCPDPCPETCDTPKPKVCTKACVKNGCECRKGYVLDKIGGICIKRKHCPVNKCKDPHAIYTECPNPCPLTCDHPNPRPCAAMCLREGCECESGYVLDTKTGKCIKLEHCPVPECPKHSHYAINDNTCPKTCGNRQVSTTDASGACAPYTGCVCDDGYFKKYDNNTGPCIHESKCPPIPTTCGTNEVATSCRIACPPQTCESIYTTYFCPQAECEPGCDCINGYLRNSEGICVPSEQCNTNNAPVCGPNEESSDCAILCPPQSCESLYLDYLCAQMECRPGCNCVKGYLRNSDGICIPSGECSARCRGDANATATSCGSACRPTCADPDRANRACILLCILNGCECKQGYILSESGVCVDPKDCPGGSPLCGTNETYTSCKVGCPTNYCPTDDSRAMVACSIAYPCPGGCACSPGYLYESYENPQCVLASDCPEVECTRPNEVWDRNPTSCYPERCDERERECVDPFPVPPRCVCKKGYHRNDSDVCVPASECPSLGCKGDLNATLTQCPTPCPATCADPNAGNKPCIEICLPEDCQCNPGYVRSEEGKCIKPEDCPAPDTCNGDPNAVFSDCPSACQATCDNPDTNQPCVRKCLPSGCVCKPGFIREKKNGKCIKQSSCPVDNGCNGDKNATETQCGSGCPITCVNRFKENNIVCPAVCLPGCSCKEGYIYTDVGGVCVKPEDCPVPEESCDGDPNAVFSDCPSACQATCDNPDTNQPCVRKCLPSGCVCKPGFIREKKNGKCIKQSSCPVDYGCNGDKNATETECGSACPTTCRNRFRKNKLACPAVCRPGCSCKRGYILTDVGGVCVKPEDCPVPEIEGCDGDPNAVFSDCPSACEPTCDDPNSSQPCILMCMPKGCVCKKGFVRGSNGKCVKVEECPVVGCGGDRNATARDCPSACPLTCADQNRNKPCPAICLPRGCDCNEGYVLTEVGGKCIKPEDCPAEPQCNGDRNATFKECPSACQATCDNPDSNQPCIDVCLPDGCVCKEGYIRIEEDGECVQPGDCPGGSPTCGANETYVYCKVGCPTNYCPTEDSQAMVACDPPYPCPGGCACKRGYLYRSRDDETCIKSSECPPFECKKPNEIWEASPSSCSSERCEDRGIPCDFPYPVPPRCVCMDGFYRNKDDVCVPESECPPIACKGDANATYSECPSPCQATCDEPDTGDACITVCDDPGCVCNDDFILSEPGGVCISPYDCPGGSPKCGENETYVSCKVSGCPSDYCPKDDSLGTVICDPIFPCPGGCVCKRGYIRLSEEDDRCVLSSECPPVECTRENEEWNTDPPSCSADRCEYKDVPCDFPIPLPPKCTCIEGYFRNSSDVCVPESECPKPACNGDQNATFSECPSPCKPTCDSPDNDVICIDMCDEPGCVCNEGFLLTELGGSCINPYDCPGGSPQCPTNKTFTSCKIDCPMRYCPTDVNEVPRVCDPLWPCPSGCECAPGYLMLNSIDQTCVLASDCPPLECTGENEEWNRDPPDCDFDSCENVNSPCNSFAPGRPRCACKEGYCKNQDGVCVPIPTEDCHPSTPVCGINEIARDCRRICPPQTCLSKYALFRCKENIPCEPGCDCVANYLRDDSGKCVPSEKCPAPCDVPDECKRTCAVPNPENCDNPRPEENIDGCSCKSGYVLSEIGGKCIPIEDCPTDQSCNGDPNAVIKQCPQPCPATCDSPNAFPCKKMCLEVGCECKPGYLKLNGTGPCVLPDQCPGGNPCGKTGRFVDCKVDCESSYCPKDDSRDVTICDPPAGSCLPGCICNLNHRKRSYEDPTCIVSSDCPPVNCTRPNEVWDSCPSACLAESCEDAHRQPTTCNTLVLNCGPRCVCKKKHFRNSSGICVPVNKCDEPC
ncbi:zonadhesin-like isoform X4 [Spodoptera frugiperda]|uniref:Zonadhesin-like isoform X4 n=1 Tax=Spodoptera frugiperda TaxID=7108 RepID=A0A9R0F6N1_SPOFR|nr:zonadhesin-like isoform X4 [Spodoptera frugiperda]